MILSTTLHLPFLLFTLFKTSHIFLRLSLLYSIFLCNNQASVFSKYSRRCYLNVGRLVEDTWSLFSQTYPQDNLCFMIDLTSAMTYRRLSPLTRIVLTGPCLFKMSRKKDFQLDQTIVSWGPYQLKGQRVFRSFISVSLIKLKLLVLLTATIFGSFLILGSLACLII